MKENIVKVVKLHLTRRRKRSLLINDSYPGIMMVVAGFGMLENGQFNVLAIASIIAGTALVALGIKEWRSSPEVESHGIQWLDVIGGVVTILDAMAIYKPWKGFQPAWLYFAVGLATTAKGVFATKIPGFRRLTIFKDGFKIRTSPFSVLKSKWTDVEVLRFEESKIYLTAKNNVKHSFKLGGIGNLSEALDVQRDAARNSMVDVGAGED